MVVCLGYFICYIRTSRFTYDLQPSLWVLASCCIWVYMICTYLRFYISKEVLPKFSWAIKCCLLSSTFLSWKLTLLGFTLQIFSADADVRLARRIRRDTVEKGRDIGAVLDQVRIAIFSSWKYLSYSVLLLVP